MLEEIMRQRGFGEEFLTPKYGEFEKLPDVEKAAKRIIEAAEKNERVIIYGDYDADGVTASTVMHDALKLAGVKEVGIMLPDRFKDGYGMSERLVERAKEVGAKLIITVDCGSGNFEIVEKLNELGAEVVVTDHHECLKELPPAVAVVNPKRRDVEVSEDMQHLAGVGVAFMVAYELMKEGKIPEGQEKWMLDLVLIGTICDAMVLTGTNRVLCSFGMKVIMKTRRPGLQELLRRTGIRTMNSEAIGFQIGPRINAAGRMRSAEIALRLLMTGSKAEAAQLAEELEQCNIQRKVEQGRARKEIAQRGVRKEKVVVEEGAWHEGVLGIIAGHITEDYRRPAFALAKVGEVVKGSGRSFGEFSLAEALADKEVAKTIIGGGGHAGACGVKLEPGKVEEFRAAVNKYYESLKLKNQEKFLEVAADLTRRDFDDLTPEEIEKTQKLEPYGEGNTEPVVLLEGVTIAEVRKMGKDEAHLSLRLVDDHGRSLRTVAFFAPEEWMKLVPNQKADVKVHLIINEWQGLKSAEGRIMEVKPLG